MRIDFYHIDGMEVANYVPIWKELRQLGVDAQLVTVPDPDNTASHGWFDFDATTAIYSEMGIPVTTVPDYDCNLAITTQYPRILCPYRGLKMRLMYGLHMLSDSFFHSEEASREFDAVLVHGHYSKRLVSRWKPEEDVLIVGYPKYDDFFRGRYQRNELLKKLGFADTRPTVVYLPTWDEASSLDIFLDAVAQLTQEYNVVIKPHHCTVRMEPERMNRIRVSPAKVVVGSTDLVFLYVVADLVLADIRSGSFSEAIALDIPVVGLTADPEDVEHNIDKTALTAGPLCTQPDDLQRVVSLMLSSDQYADARRRLGDILVSYRDGTAARHAANEIIKFVERKQDTKSYQAPSCQSCRVPGVSVVLPTYNHLKFLPPAVESVLAQTYDDFELIIVNDGSTDGTREYLDSLKDPRVRVIHQENKRLPEALNTGFRTARGELLTWVSSDNYCAPIFLEAFVAALDAHPDAGFAYSSYAVIDEDGHITRIRQDQNISYHLLLAGNPGIASFMYRRVCQQKVGLYDPALECAEDWDMWLRILEQFQSVYVPDILYYYRLHEDSMTEKIRERVFRASRQAFQKAVERRNNQLDVADLYPTLQLCRDRKTAEFYAYFDLGTSLLQSPHTQVEPACQALEKVLSMAPDSFQAAGNLAVAYGRLGQWEKVLPLLRQITQKSENPKVLGICRSIAQAQKANNPDLLAQTPLFVPDKKSIELFQLEERDKRVFSFTDTNRRFYKTDRT